MMDLTYEQRIDSELDELEGYLHGLEAICCADFDGTIELGELWSLIHMAVEKVEKARAIRPPKTPPKPLKQYVDECHRVSKGIPQQRRPMGKSSPDGV